MSVAHEPNELRRILDRALTVSPEHPVVVSKFETHAREVEIDAVADQGEIVLWAISEHIEDAGVHSGDATLVLPPQTLYIATIRRVKKIAADVARALEITGPFNVQFLAKHNTVKVIECNLRASRSFPFVSKVTGTNLAAEAMRRMLGRRGIRSRTTAWISTTSGSRRRCSRSRGSSGRIRCSASRWRAPARSAASAMTCTKRCCTRCSPPGFRFPKRGVLLSLGPLAGQVLVRRRGARDRRGTEAPDLRDARHRRRLHGLGIAATRLEKHDGPDSGMRAIDDGEVDLVINVPASTTSSAGPTAT